MHVKLARSANTQAFALTDTIVSLARSTRYLLTTIRWHHSANGLRPGPAASPVIDSLSSTLAGLLIYVWVTLALCLALDLE